MHKSDVVKRQNNKNLLSGRTENHKLISVNHFPNVTGYIRCPSQGIHWCQTSSNCFPDRIRQMS